MPFPQRRVGDSVRPPAHLVRIVYLLGIDHPSATPRSKSLGWRRTMPTGTGRPATSGDRLSPRARARRWCSWHAPVRPLTDLVALGLLILFEFEQLLAWQVPLNALAH